MLDFLPQTPFFALVRKNFTLRQRSRRGIRCDLILPVLTWVLSVSLFYMIAGAVDGSSEDTGNYSWRPVVSDGNACQFYEWDDEESLSGDCLQLLYAPNTHAGVVDVMHTVSMSHVSIKGFATEADLADYAGTEFDIWAGIVFNLDEAQAESGSLLPGGESAVNVSIRMPEANLPSTNPSNTIVWSGYDDPSTPAEFFDEGFLALQQALFEGMLENYNIDDVTVSSAIQRFPYLGDKSLGSSTIDGVDWTLYHVFKSLLGVFLVLHVSLWFFKMSTDLVQEKAVRARAMMQMMGLGDLAYWGSWFTTSMMMMVPITLFMLALNALLGWSSGSNFFALWLVYLVATAGMTVFCFVIAACIDKARYAGPLTVLLLWGIAGAAMVVAAFNDEGAPALKKWLSLLPTAGLVIINYETIATLQKHDSGLTFSTMGDTDPGCNTILLIMFLDIFLYALLAWYLDNVVPGEFGAARHPLFFLEASYWRGRAPEGGMTQPLLSDDGHADGSVEPPEDPDAPVAIDVRHLRKVYDDGTVAVEDLNIKFYEGHISAFLGHNGAGKSTTISMLTGLYPPTSGDATVLGHSIASDMDGVRKSLGICPQHDVYWPTLTVREHLQLFGALKGCSPSRVDAEIDELLEDLCISQKADYAAGSLSGGQRRKLSVAMALIGGSSIVILDECTSGVDVSARREIWRCLTKHKKGRSMLLVTHFLDEADVLGDRVAILSAGKLRCCGSALFLKNKFGVGYSLTISKDGEAPVAPITELVRGYVPQASVISDVAGELAYRLPMDSTAAFPDLFTELDGAAAKAVGVKSYGLGSSTLEDVFLRLAHEQAPDHELGATAMERKASRRKSFATNESFQEEERMRVAMRDDAVQTPSQGISVFQQFMALYKKRARLAARHRGHTIGNMAAPVGMVFCALLLWQAQLHTYPASQDALELNFRDYAGFGFNEAVYYEPSADTATADADALIEAWGGRPVPVDDALEVGENKFSNVVGSLGLDVDVADGRYNMTNYYNDSVAMVLPNALASLHNSALLGSSAGVGFHVQDFPLPTSSFNLALSNINAVAYSGLLFGMAIAFYSGACAAYVVREEAAQQKYLQLVNGCSKLTYWFANMAWDMTVWFVITGFMMIAFSSFNYGWVDHPGNGLFGVWMLLLACMPSSLLSAYLLGRQAGDPNTVQGSQTFLAFCWVFVSLSATASPAVTEGPASIGVRILCYIFNAPYAPGAAAYGILIIGDLCGMRSTVGLPSDASVFEWGIVGYIFVFLLGSTFCWGVALFGSDVGLRELFCSCLPRGASVPSFWQPDSDAEAAAHREDEDVAAEAQRVNAGRDLPGFEQDYIQLRGVRKVFYSKTDDGSEKVAVRNLTLGIPQGEVLGLLGHNGAGKSTTMNMLSGELTPTFGETFIANCSVADAPGEALRHCGLCPQYDLLFPRLTAYETLEFYARLKGIPEHRVKPVAAAFVELTGLSKFAHKWAGGYSGGNKRKLSLAVALIGNPGAVLLDEPSTGMDPEARRSMWQLIQMLREDKAVALTSHSMEEVEALASRIAIMHQGEMVCLGSAQHLKHRFGNGYALSLQCDSTEHAQRVIEFIAERLPTSRLLEHNTVKMVIEVPPEAAGLAELFRIIEEMKQGDYGVTDYSVAQPSLEQIFCQLSHTSADDEAATVQKGNVVNWKDLMHGFIWLLYSVFIPGVHQLRLGNWTRFFVYFVTYNGVCIGWLWDLIFLDLKVRDQVRKYGHLSHCQAACFGSRGWNDVWPDEAAPAAGGAAGPSSYQKL